MLRDERVRARERTRIALDAIKHTSQITFWKNRYPCSTGASLVEKEAAKVSQNKVDGWIYRSFTCLSAVWRTTEIK